MSDKIQPEILNTAFLRSLTGVIFINSLDLSRTLEIALSLKKDKGLPFDGMQEIPPIPMDSPLEIPRIILANAGGTIRCAISADRIVLSLGAEKAPIKDNNATAYLEKYLPRIIEILKKEFNCKMSRIGVGFNNLIFLNESSNSLLQKKYLKFNPGPNVSRTQLSFICKEKMGAFSINKGIKITTLRKKSDRTDDKALQIDLEINTIPQINYDLPSLEIGSFVKSAINTADLAIMSILKANK